MRIPTFPLISLAALAFALPATAALNIDVSSDVADLQSLTPGQEFTLTIELSTTTADEARALNLFATGWSEGDLEFVSATIPNFGGEAAPNGSVFGVELGPDAIVVFGIGNSLDGPIDNGTNVHLFGGFSQTPAAGTGPDSFTLTLLANAGSGAIEIGGVEELGGHYIDDATGVFSYPSVSVAYLVVPEPGTALLTSLGLAALAGRRHRAT